jgi:dolichol-phosphate mannosyltransferase
MILSLVVPTYNERHNIVPLVRQATAALEKVSDNFEIIVVDDDSPDGTWQVAEELAGDNAHLRVIRRRGEKGLATAVIAGWKAARGDILGVMDGDLQHPPQVLSELLSSIVNTGADVVIASRNVPGGGVSDWSLFRRSISWGATSLTTLILSGIFQITRDPMSGCFLVKRSVVDFDNLNPEGYKILLEVLARGDYRTVVEVPYSFQERKEGGSKLGLAQYVGFFIHLGRLAWETGQIGRFFRFCAVGISGLFVNGVALNFFAEAEGLNYLSASVFAMESAIISNFILNELWTFRDRSSRKTGMANRLKRFYRFNLICAVGAILNTVVSWALTHLAGIYLPMSALIGFGLATLWNYGLNSNYTWQVPIERKASPPKN